MSSYPDNSSPHSARLEFDDVVVDAENYRVYKRGALRSIGPRAFDLLLYLVSHPGRVVTKDELFDRVWHGVSVTDNALTRAVKDLRRAIGDDAKAPRYVETAARRGYRFVADVRKAAGTAHVSLLVLPFDDLSAAPEPYLTDGLAGELIAQLGRINPDRLSVIAWSSAVSASAGGRLWADVGRELGVDWVVQGSVRRDDRRVQATVNLGRLTDETPQWSDAFDEEATDVLDVQHRLAAAIAERIHVELVREPGSRPVRAVGPAAHAALLEGQYFFRNRTADSIEKARAAYQRALALEPDCARAHVGIARCLVFDLMIRGSKGEVLVPARAAIDRALALDDRLAEAHTMRALLLSADWQFAEAERSLRWAVALDPNDPWARHWLAMFALVTSGRFEEALEELRRARRLDPLSLIISADIGSVYCMTRQFDRAMTQCTESLRLDPQFARAHVYLGWARLGLGRYEAAVVALETAARLDSSAWTRAWLGQAYGVAGRTDDARAVLQGFLDEAHRGEGEMPFYTGVVYAGLGETDAALASFERAVDNRSFWVTVAPALPALDHMRAAPRFNRLLERIRAETSRDDA